MLPAAPELSSAAFTLQPVITGKIKTEKFLPKQGKRTHTQKVLSHVQCRVLQR